jgi:Icc protein
MGTEVALFMHTYPSDLRDEAEKQQVTALLAQHRVALVDMGHTHYNELANDGTTIYAATRSTGQIEEGPRWLFAHQPRWRHRKLAL